MKFFHVALAGAAAFLGYKLVTGGVHVGDDVTVPAGAIANGAQMGLGALAPQALGIVVQVTRIGPGDVIAGTIIGYTLAINGTVQPITNGPPASFTKKDVLAIYRAGKQVA